MNAHPSRYALDRAALGAPVDPALAAHLARCPGCASRLAEARRPPAERPAWLDQVRAPRRRPALPWHRLGLVPALAAAALALVVAVPALRARTGPDGGVRAKGAPRVTVYVKRGDAVAVWDGAPVRPGDRLRVGIRAPGFAQVSVASVSTAAAPAVLYAGPLAGEGETLLPLGLRVDASGSAEVLSVVVSTRPIEPSAHLEPPPGAPGARWSTRLVFPREVSF